MIWSKHSNDTNCLSTSWQKPWRWLCAWWISWTACYWQMSRGEEGNLKEVTIFSTKFFKGRVAVKALIQINFSLHLTNMNDKAVLLHVLANASIWQNWHALPYLVIPTAKSPGRFWVGCQSNFEFIVPLGKCECPPRILVKSHD